MSSVVVLDGSGGGGDDMEGDVTRASSLGSTVVGFDFVTISAFEGVSCAATATPVSSGAPPVSLELGSSSSSPSSSLLWGDVMGGRGRRGGGLEGGGLPRVSSASSATLLLLRLLIVS
jgi:hypothetical protein